MDLGAGRGFGFRTSFEGAVARSLDPLVLAGVLALGLRLTLALGAPEFDNDAYGHLKLASAFLKDPANPRVHWVWLPGWHVALAGGMLLGAGHTSVRVVNALLQTLGPWLVYRIASEQVAGRGAPDRSLARSAALFYTVAPLPNLMGSSAQMETAFALLLLGAALALMRGRGLMAGVLLGLAALVRYEAWGVVALLAVRCALHRERRRTALVAFAVSAAAIGAWLCLRRLEGLPWFSFAAATKTFVARYRDAADMTVWVDVARLVALPFWTLGPAAGFALAGIAALKTRAIEVPAGVLAVLAGSAFAAALLPLPRYLTALTPFACIAIASGVMRWSAQRPWPNATRLSRSIAASLVLLTMLHLGFMLKRVGE